MIGDLKPYAAYKDSGVPWLGDVPEHWEALPLSAAFKPKLIKNWGMAEKAVLSLSYGQIVIKPHEKLHGLVPESFETYQIVDPGNIIIRTTDLQNDQVSLRVGIAKHRGIITSAYLCLRAINSLSEDYGYLLLNSYDLLKIFYGYGSGLRQNLDFAHIKRMPILKPPVEEQAAIATFLDYADRRIRRYIRSKQKLIKLLEEQKQVVINQAVTRGLDPNVPLKPSGIEWLGDIPEHWSITQIRSVAKIVRGGSPRPAGSPVYFHGNHTPWITVAELTKDRGMHLESTSTKLTAEGVKHSRLIARGTLLLTNSGATLGIPKITAIEGCINDGVAAFLNIRPSIRKEFFYFYLGTQTAHLKAWVDLGAQPNLNTQIIGGWPVPLPPVNEQLEIVQHIQKALPELDSAAHKANQEISLL
jgi:type I restriction enzyme, S subunit